MTRFSIVIAVNRCTSTRTCSIPMAVNGNAFRRLATHKSENGAAMDNNIYTFSDHWSVGGSNGCPHSCGLYLFVLTTNYSQTMNHKNLDTVVESTKMKLAVFTPLPGRVPLIVFSECP